MTGQKTWAIGEEVLAADFNNFVQTQVVAQFANNAARDAWGAPPNGALAVTLDTNTLWQRIAGAWVQAAFRAPSGGSYPYGMNFYTAAQSGNVVLTTTSTTNLVVNLPALPLNTIIDISCHVYMNETAAGTGGAQAIIDIGGTTYNPAIVVPDIVALGTFSAKIPAFVTPTPGVAVTVNMKVSKFAAGGAIQVQAAHTVINVTTWRP